jgi:hypothetical protein
MLWIFDPTTTIEVRCSTLPLPSMTVSARSTMGLLCAASCATAVPPKHPATAIMLANALTADRDIILNTDLNSLELQTMTATLPLTFSCPHGMLASTP